jgi:hypothetical protein
MSAIASHPHPRAPGRPCAADDPVLCARDFRFAVAQLVGHHPAAIGLAECPPIDRRTVARGIRRGALALAGLARSAGLDFGDAAEGPDGPARAIKNATSRRRTDQPGSRDQA